MIEKSNKKYNVALYRKYISYINYRVEMQRYIITTADHTYEYNNAVLYATLLQPFK